MKNLLLTALLALAGLSGAHATNYYVSASGGTNTTANGTGLSPTNAFATIQYAADLTNPGDTVFVRAGTYVNTGTASAVFTVRRSGTAAGGYITYRNYPGDAQKPLLQFNTYYGIGFANTASYIQIIGFRIQGSNRNINLTAATNQPGGCAANGVGTVDPLYNGTGISVIGRGAPANGHPNHLLIRGNEVFECSQAGISAIEADYVTIENNLVYNNSWYTIYGSSGISVLNSWNSDNTTGYRTIIRGNRVFGNQLLVPWYQSGGRICKGLTDGNGIIIDTNTTYAYVGRTLIANNLLVDNGGAGIVFFQSYHADIINNTLYHNSKTSSNGGGDLVVAYSQDVLAQNNIVSTSTGKAKGTVKYNTANVAFNFNLFFGGNNLSVFNNTVGAYTNTNVVTTDPQFVSPGTDFSTTNFRVPANSPAINAGLNNLLSTTDVAGNPRLVGAAPDLGAYEFMPVLATGSTTWLGNGTTDWNTAANWSAGVPTGTVDVAISANSSPYPLITNGNSAVLGLAIGSGASLTISGGTLDVRGNLSNSGTFSATGGTLNLSGTAPQTLGGTGSTQLWSLTIANPAGASQNGPVSIRGVLAPASGNLTTSGQALTLLSDASGTALVNNSGTGSVSGNATVQRYIDPSQNAGLGYRHYSAPVAGSTVADLATAGFGPEVSQASAYNASATPGSTTPFPTVFDYDQSRVTLTNSYAPFDRGFEVPASLATPLAAGRGYAVNIGAAELVDFVGALNNGDLPVALTRNAAGSANDTDAGWQLLGNPYPAPLDYSLVAAADRAGLDAAMYVYASASQYGGSYRSYVNGIGNPVLPVGQGFFVRVSSGQTSGLLTFRNNQRLATSPGTPFQRTTTDVRPLVQLELRSPGGLTDALFAYAETGATPAFDAPYDALKLANTTGLNLAAVASTGEALAVDGRPAFTTATVLPLNVAVPAAGTYTLTALALNNLPATLDAVLTDAVTSLTINLRQQPAYSFSVSAPQAATGGTGRFTLRFAARVLATAPALTAAEVTLYPNPAHAAFTVLVPAVAGATQVEAVLLNALGQVVRRQSAALPATGARFVVDAGGLTAGIYTLRLQAGAANLTKRVVLQ
ncbi:choice-of-anchor Q domain-containing protein [Hymenobacter terricola]|uniref:choice-of-anchor Q domain-containing protein n=1 Tax=Hymenobacter terricola TaxID=2819236 RepID=UPI001B305F23|nr:choice-of-anchor Q domain-containing protein [Hymenobacter terricola]